jgi:hypothetical protein
VIKWEPLPWPKTGQLKLHIALDKIREVYREESGVSLDKIWPCKAVECHAVEVPDPVQPPTMPREHYDTIDSALSVGIVNCMIDADRESQAAYEAALIWLREQFGGNDDTVR